MARQVIRERRSRTIPRYCELPQLRFDRCSAVTSYSYRLGKTVVFTYALPTPALLRAVLALGLEGLADGHGGGLRRRVRC